MDSSDGCLLTLSPLAEFSHSLPIPLPFDVSIDSEGGQSALSFGADALQCMMLMCGTTGASTVAAVNAVAELFTTATATASTASAATSDDNSKPATDSSAGAVVPAAIRSPVPYRPAATHHHQHHHHQLSHLFAAKAVATSSLAGLVGRRPPYHIAATDPRRCSFFNIRCGCLFSLIPDDVLVDCFTFLDLRELCAISSVSSRWRYLTSEPQLWTSLDLSAYNRIRSSAPASGGENGESDTGVSAEERDAVNDQLLVGLRPRFGESIESLKLCECVHVSTAALLEIASIRLLRLTELHLCQLPAVTDAVLIRFLTTNGRHLRSLSVFGCTKLTNASVSEIGRLCPQLLELSVRGCSKITADAFRDAAVSSGSAAASASGALVSTLHSLNVSSCRGLNGADVVFAIARACPNLRRLNLHALNGITDAAVVSLARACSELSSVHLSSANPFGGGGVTGWTDVALLAIAKFCPQLKFIDLQGANTITDAGASALFAACGTTLSRLNLGGCERLTDAAIHSLVRHCPNLTQLSLFHCTKLTDESLAAIASGNLPRLQQLDLHSCTSLTPSAVSALVTATAPGLQRVSNSFVRSVSTPAPAAAAVMSPSASSTSLMSLTSPSAAAAGAAGTEPPSPPQSQSPPPFTVGADDTKAPAPVSSNSRMSRTLSFDDDDTSPAAIAAIAAAAAAASVSPTAESAQLCTPLRRIPTSVAPLSLVPVSGGLPELRSIDVGGCPQLTEQSVAVLAQSRPELRITF